MDIQLVSHSFISNEQILDPVEKCLQGIRNIDVVEIILKIISTHGEQSPQTESSAAESDDIDDDIVKLLGLLITCLLYTSPSPRDGLLSRMPSSA